MLRASVSSLGTIGGDRLGALLGYRFVRRLTLEVMTEVVQVARGERFGGRRFGRMFLHARRLAFEHPSTGQVIELEAPLPAEFESLLAALGPAAAPSRLP